MLTHKINLHKINQFGNSTTELKKGVYNAIIPFEKIVRSLKFTHRQSPNKGNDEEYFQRLTSDSRVQDIIQFLIRQSESNTFISFPLNFILSIDLVEDDFKSESDYLLFLDDINIENDNKLSYIIKDELIIPEIDNILIVDGQHRLAALKYLYYGLNFEEKTDIKDIDERFLNKVVNIIDKVYESFITDNLHKDSKEDFETIQQYYLKRKKALLQKIKDFTICATLLVDFDIYEQAKVFADVNFNQKPVNKSLYYDIYGSFPNEDHNDIYIVHNWCKRLNEDDDSVLKDKIKMLGSGSGFVSQAFICDEFLALVRKGGVWEEIMNDYINEREDNTEKLLEFIKNYFRGIFNFYSDTNPRLWPQNDETAFSTKTIILKTTGLGALIKLIPYFYREYYGNKDLVRKVMNRFGNIKDFIDGNDKSRKISGEYYFSKENGEFSKGAGKGLQDKLFKALKNDLGFKDEIKERVLFSL